MKAVADVLGISRSNLYVQARPVRRRARYDMREDEILLPMVRKIIDERQTYGYRRVTALLNRTLASLGMPSVNHKRVYRIMHQNGLLLSRRGGGRISTKHDGTVETTKRNTRWCADGFEVRCDNGEHVRVIFGLDTCDREVMAFAATTGGYTAEMAQSVMLACVEYRFKSDRAPHAVEWLTDNGSCFTAKETTEFGERLGIACRFTPVRSPQSNGMAESFVKTFKRDYIFSHRRDDACTVMSHLKEWMEDYNEKAPHKGLRMLSPREFIRSQSN